MCDLFSFTFFRLELSHAATFLVIRKAYTDSRYVLKQSRNGSLKNKNISNKRAPPSQNRVTVYRVRTSDFSESSLLVL